MSTKTGELREMLIAAIEDVRSGKMPPEKGLALAKMAAAVTSSLQVEINAAKELRAMGVKIDAPVGSMSLGETAKLTRAA